MTIYPTSIRGESRWCLDLGVRSGHRRRKYFHTHSQARQALHAARQDHQEIGRSWSRLPARSRARIVTLLGDMDQVGVGLEQLWDAYQQRKELPVTKLRRLGDAIQEITEVKLAANRRPRYVESLSLYLRAFARGRENRPVSSITPAEVEQWVGAQGKASTRRGVLSRLASFFSFCQRRGYVVDNPCTRIERITLEAMPPKILTAKQTERLLKLAWAEAPEVLAYLVLGLFAGVRPEEIHRLRWEDLDLEAGVVRIDAAASKVRFRRITHLSPNAVAWLRRVESGDDMKPVSPGLTRVRTKRIALAKKAGIEWDHDIMRHTSASMMLARDQDAGKVAEQLGHSPAILLRHYRELVSGEAVARYWRVLPEMKESAQGSAFRGQA